MRCKVKWDKRREVWFARPYLGRTADGKAIQPYREFPTAKDEEQAQEMADAWASKLSANGLVLSALLGDLLDDYTEYCELAGFSPNTVRSYRLFTKYAVRYFGAVNACDLQTHNFTNFEITLRRPKSKKGFELSQNTVRNVHDFLRGAYSWFVEENICQINPLIAVTKPRLETHEAISLATVDFAKLDERLKAMLKPEVLNKVTYRRVLNAFAAWFALRTGMRCGEVCALWPNEISEAAKTIHIAGTVIEQKGKRPYRRNVTKGRRNRTIEIAESDLQVIADFLELRKGFCGDLPADAPLITIDGSYCRPSTISRAFSVIAAKAGMPKGLTYHGLRHTHATWLLVNGVDVKTVSNRLGHADEAITVKTYAHRMPGSGKRAASVFEQAAEAAHIELKELLQ